MRIVVFFSHESQFPNFEIYVKVDYSGWVSKIVQKAWVYFRNSDIESLTVHDSDGEWNVQQENRVSHAYHGHWFDFSNVHMINSIVGDFRIEQITTIVDNWKPL